MKNVFLILFILISAAIFVDSVFYLFKSIRKKLFRDKGLTPVQWCTVGVFIAMVLMYMPVYYSSFKFLRDIDFLRPFLLSLFSSLRGFILDADIDSVITAFSKSPWYIRVPYGFYSVLLAVVAPVLTFGNALSLFRNVLGEIRYTFTKNRPFYIMSELNTRSVALAKDIYNKKSALEPVIVFTDVFVQNEEKDYELLGEARQLDAICLKRDISNLDIISKKAGVELFLMGDDESENVSQGVKIVNSLKKAGNEHDVKIFIFSHKKSAEYIIDSAQDEKLIEYPGFKLRRINEIELLALNTVPEMKVFDIAQSHGNVLSVLIAGFGAHGFEFFKTLTWFCQFEGYKLKMTVVDKKPDGYASSLINRHCPDLLKTNKSTVNGDAYYDIEVLSGVDITTDGFDRIIDYEGTDPAKRALAERLKGVNLAIVALGDDDANIEEAVHIRNVFDKVNRIPANKTITHEQETPKIYSVVYDDHKFDILSGTKETDGEGSTDFLKNYKDIPYHINFIGSMSSRYNYSAIYNEELEDRAYNVQHIGWVKVQETMKKEMDAEEQRKAAADKDYVPITKWEWYCEGANTPESIKREKKNYENYEYYRRSSIAKELYSKAIKENGKLGKLTACEKGGGRQICDCASCERRKKSEHMRWNAYTRIIGFAYRDGLRLDRGLLHKSLIGWDELDPIEKAKD